MTNDTHATEANLTVYIGLGSNVGDREANLREAVKRIERLGAEVVRRSSVYETEPAGLRNQPWFLNQVIEARVLAGLTSDRREIAGNAMDSIKAEGLLSELLDIERAMGRERTIVNGPRVIDIDLLLFGDMVIAPAKDDRTDIFIPHPRMHLRRFVLEPLCEIAPGVIHPVLKKTCREILASLEDPSIVRRYDPTPADS